MRNAGQYGKPRSSEWELVDGEPVLALRSHPEGQSLQELRPLLTEWEASVDADATALRAAAPGEGA